MDKKPLKVLCLDGGGVRGLSSLLILRVLMDQLKVTSNLTDVPLPCEVFDLICGTSTGGLIALMLGRLRMSVHDAIVHYLDFSRAVFGEKVVPEEKAATSSFLGFLRRDPSRKDTTQSKRSDASSLYDASKLEKWVKDVVAKYENTADAPLKDPLDADHFCRTFVVAASRDHLAAPARLFRTYTPADSCKIWEAVRATTAAVPFFDAATFGVPRETYIDGSYSLANNPSKLAMQEVHVAFPKQKIDCFLSLGTGVPDVISAAGGSEKVAEACMKLIKDCELVHDEVANEFENMEGKIGEPYFRFSVSMGLNKIELDEWNREEELTGITGGYMRGFEQKQRTNKFLEGLKVRASEIAVKQENAASIV